MRLEVEQSLTLIWWRMRTDRGAGGLGTECDKISARNRI